MIDIDPPREWNGPKGKVYYITVGLEGHSKPVTIGKKTPDALKVGDTVYGEIEPTDYTTDKWKHGEPPQVTNSSSSAGKDNSFMKDITNTPILIYNGSLNYAKESGLNLISDKEDRRLYLEYVKDITDEMLDWIDKIRGSDGGPPALGDAVPTPSSSQTQVQPKPVAATTLADRWQQATNTKATQLNDAPPYGDEDIPNEPN